MYENADFSPETIKSSIREGEIKAIQELKSRLNQGMKSTKGTKDSLNIRSDSDKSFYR